MLGQLTGLLGLELTSALAGVTGGIVTYGALNWNQRRIERDRFRRSLLFEIRHIGDVLADLDSSENIGDGADLDELQALLSTDLLDADFQSIGKLTTRELQHVYRFYEACNVVRDKLAGNGSAASEVPVQEQIETALAYRDTAIDAIDRSRLSQLTEWYKDVDAKR